MQIQGFEKHYWFFTGWLMPVELAAVYITAYILVPRLLLRRRFIAFIGSFVLSAVFFILLERAIYYYILYPAVYPRALERPFFSFLDLWFLGLNVYSFVFLFSGVRLFRSWAQEQRQQMELEKQKMSSELALLRSQINPHFLFNTLNNIDLLVFKDQQKASDSIVKLSEIMRYMLYEANTEEVPLERELQYLEGMVDLMRLRVKDPAFIEFSILGDLVGNRIPPMLLVPFVENAFKHGKKSGEPPGIEIEFIQEKEHYLFTVRNQLEKNFQMTRDRVGGIGLNNVRRRLDLLYGEDYQLDIHKTDDHFEVKLIIPIHSRVERPVMNLV